MRTPLSTLGLPEKKLKRLSKKGFQTIEQMTRYFPYRYMDVRNAYSLHKSTDGPYAIIGTIKQHWKEQKSTYWFVKATIEDEITGELLHITWIGKSYMSSILNSFPIDTRFLIYGDIKWLDEYEGYYLTNPDIFSPSIAKDQKIHPIYEKIRDISEDAVKDLIHTSIQDTTEEELIPKETLSRLRLPDISTSLKMIHNPGTPDDIELAKTRFVFDDLMYFASKMEMDRRRRCIGSPYNVKTLKSANHLLSVLPYELTADQEATYDALLNCMRNGKRINAVVQGDVGCGKTIIAILMLSVIADAGSQGLLMAPTTVLAKQHFKDIQTLLPGISSILLCGDMTAAQKKKAAKEIAEGSVSIIVATHSAVSKTIAYHDLALAITDEEHKFGVAQRESLLEKAERGCHMIKMSATPIPRTIQTTLYSDTDIYSIKTMPPGRKPVRTQIFNKLHGILRFIELEIEKGRQAYVVCPAIEKKEIAQGLATVEETVVAYRTFFEPKGILVDELNGKMKASEVKDTLERFTSGETKVLISTTVIEVGVNVPNASTIVINNAESFGLAALHQLRGRVGRGNTQGYCILNSEETDNERLRCLCDTNDGFEIAEMDLKLRGSGNLIGIEQSGDNHYINLVLEHPAFFKSIEELSKEFVDSGIAEKFTEMYEETIKEKI